MSHPIKKPVYLDYAATTPIDKRVVQKMMRCLSETEGFGNAAANHSYGVEAKTLIEEARLDVANLIGTVPRNIVFTSGATEANNLALKGAALFYQAQGKHIITAVTEHRSVLESCQFLEKSGFEVTYLKTGSDGIVDPELIKKTLRKDTILVSIMQVNNETGVIQDIQAIGEMTRAANILFHVDAVQSVGKLPINLEKLSVDLMSFSAHKLYGPKGIGALYVGDKPRIKLLPQLQGGGQERGFRAGTLPTHQIVGMGEAFKIAQQCMTDDVQKILKLKQLLWNGLNSLNNLGTLKLNGHLDIRNSVCGILNIAFLDKPKDAFQAILKEVAISNASACNTVTLEPSHVLKGMGLTNEMADRSFRFSLGRFTTVAEIETVIELFRGI